MVDVLAGAIGMGYSAGVALDLLAGPLGSVFGIAVFMLLLYAPYTQIKKVKDDKLRNILYAAWTVFFVGVSVLILSVMINQASARLAYWRS